MDKQPEQHKAISIASVLIESAAGLVPLAGGAISALAIPALNARHMRRMKAWLDFLAEGIERLQLDVAALSTDDSFLDAMLAATNAAANTDRHEKLTALRNSVINNAFATSRPGQEISQRFIRLIDEMSESHLRLMTYFEDPRKWFLDSPDAAIPDVATHTQLALIAMGWEESEETRLDWLLEDLKTWRILGMFSDSTGSSSGLLESKHLTSMGRAFMDFIRDPDAASTTTTQ